MPQNPAIEHTHYCTISYKPLIPKRKDFELLVRGEPEELVGMFAKLPKSHSNSTDAFTDILSFAQYYHYVYYKFGTCFPIRCSPFDVQSVASLLGRRAILTLGPVKCFSKNETDYTSVPNGNSSLQLKISTTRDLNNGIYIWKPHMTQTQRNSLIALAIVALVIIHFTLIDLIINQVPGCYKLLMGSGVKRANGHIDLTVINETTTTTDDINNNNNNNNDSSDKSATNGLLNTSANSRPKVASGREPTTYLSLVDDCSIIQNFKRFLSVESELSADPDREIFCIHGIRCITMSWIIITHTMQYNDWSAFARTRLVESHLESLINQPLFNGSYLVDTFFLISGLLSSYTIFRNPGGAAAARSRRHQSSARPNQAEEEQQRGHSSSSPSPNPNVAHHLSKRFSTRAYLIGRYLRLTPQVLFTSLLFIVLPLITTSGGPHWYTMTGEYSEYCSKNWWVNLLHIQAFYRPSEMCNFVSWWISVDMFYHLFGLALILVAINWGPRWALSSCALLVVANLGLQFKRHYELELPPNLLSTIPQAGAMWTKMTIHFFWSPLAHAFPFFWGFYVGFEMARRGAAIAGWLSPRRACAGWLLVIVLLGAQSYSTYFWVVGRWRYSRLESAAFYALSSLNWSLGVSWIIVACKHGYGAWINGLLSSTLFIVLSRTSYLVYLSHFLVLFLFFGSQNVLLEPSHLMMSYIIVGNICVSMLFGSILCVLFEMPWLNVHRRLMRLVR